MSDVCTCEARFTCGFCLARAKPGHFTVGKVEPWTADALYSALRRAGGMTLLVHPGDWTRALAAAVGRRAKRDGLRVSVITRDEVIVSLVEA